MKVVSIRSCADWNAYEGQKWLEAVRDRGLRLNSLPDNYRLAIERAEVRNRALIVQGAA